MLLLNIFASLQSELGIGHWALGKQGKQGIGQTGNWALGIGNWALVTVNSQQSTVNSQESTVNS
ncbi:hypothetical protein QT990_01665 [Microcoleus sp. T3_B1]|uniref:hypothetical protein n=1 Tax=Microcoleus sp. T3_B1 TaxID=3055425 RepID=UPI002FD0DC56